MARHLLAHLDRCSQLPSNRDKNGFIPLRYEHFLKGKLKKCPKKELLDAGLLEQTDYRYTEHRSREYRIGVNLRDKLAEIIWIPGEATVRISCGKVKQTRLAKESISSRKYSLDKGIYPSCELYRQALKLEQRSIRLNLTEVIEYHRQQTLKFQELKSKTSNTHIAYRIQCQIDHPQWCLTELIRQGSYDSNSQTVTINPQYIIHLGGRRYCPEIQNLPRLYKRKVFCDLYEIDLKSCYTVLLGILFTKAGMDIPERFKLLEESNYKENLATKLGFTDIDAIKPIIHALEFGGRLSWPRVSSIKKTDAIILSCKQIAAAEKGYNLYPGRHIPAILSEIIKAVAIQEELDLTIDEIDTQTQQHIISAYNEANLALSPLARENKRGIKALHRWATGEAKENILINAIGQRLDLGNLPKNSHDKNNALLTFLAQGLEAKLIAMAEVTLGNQGANVIINEHDGFRCDIPVDNSLTKQLRNYFLTDDKTNMEERIISQIQLVTKYQPFSSNN